MKRPKPRTVFIVYSLLVILAALIMHALGPLNFYATDEYFFHGVSKYIAAGKFENSNFFWHIYPLTFSLSFIPLDFLVPEIDQKTMGLIYMTALLILGPLLFHLAHKKQSALHTLFFFFFASSGFFVVEYLIGMPMTAQAFAYLLVPLFPAILFSKRKHAIAQSALLLFLIYLLHSATALILLLASTVAFMWKPTRKKVWPFFLLLSPLLVIKLSHLLLMLGQTDLSALPFQGFLKNLSLATAERGFQEVYLKLSGFQFLLSGVPIFFWLMALPFLKKKKKRPEAYWFLSLFAVMSFAVIFYNTWSLLLPLGWPRDRYLGFLWLSFALTLPFTFKAMKPNFKKAFIALAMLFIIFEFTMAFHRQMAEFPYVEEQIQWIESLADEVTDDSGPILYMAPKNFATYAYGTFAPHDIYFHYPADGGDSTKAGVLNKYTNFATFLSTSKEPEDIEAFIRENQISLVVYHESFNEIFSFLETSDNFVFVSSFQDEASAFRPI